MKSSTRNSFPNDLEKQKSGSHKSVYHEEEKQENLGLKLALRITCF